MHTGLATVSDGAEADADDAGVGDDVEHPTKPKHARATKLITTNRVCATSRTLCCAICDVQNARRGRLICLIDRFELSRGEPSASGCSTVRPEQTPSGAWIHGCGVRRLILSPFQCPVSVVQVLLFPPGQPWLWGNGSSSPTVSTRTRQRGLNRSGGHPGLWALSGSGWRTQVSVPIESEAGNPNRDETAAGGSHAVAETGHADTHPDTRSRQDVFERSDANVLPPAPAHAYPASPKTAAR